MFNRKNKKKGNAPKGRRLYAVGDIHGCADLLDELLEKIEEDADGAAKQLIFLGDYVDRGPDSKGVIDRLVAQQKKAPDTVFLKGNHEATMLDFLHDPEDMLHWLDWGGLETLESYGLDQVIQRSGEDLAEELVRNMPKSHRTFLEGLTLNGNSWRLFLCSCRYKTGRSAGRAGRRRYVVDQKTVSQRFA